MKTLKRIVVIVAIIIVMAFFSILFSGCFSKNTEKSLNGEQGFANVDSDFVKCGDIIYFAETLRTLIGVEQYEQDGMTITRVGEVKEVARISALDTASGECMPLCGKPECTHDNAECNAYIDVKGLAARLSLSEGRLYWVQGGLRNPLLLSMNTDGTDRREDAHIDPELYRLTYGAGTAEVKDGVLYVCGTGSSVLNGEAKECAAAFLQELGAEKGELIYEADGCPMAFGRIMDGRLYFAFGDTYGEEPEKPLETRLFAWDIGKKELTELYSKAEPEAAYRSIIAADGRVYLGGYDRLLAYDPADGSVSEYGKAEAGSGAMMVWEKGGRYTCLDPAGNELYRGVFPPEGDSSFPQGCGRSFIGSSGTGFYYRCEGMLPDGRRRVDIAELDIEKQTAKVIYSIEDRLG